MTIYLIPAKDRMRDDGKAVGWFPVKQRKNQSRFPDIAPLTTRVIRVISDDIHADDAKAIATAVSVESETGFKFRPFNVGRSKGLDGEYVEGILDGIQDRWKTNPDIPIKGGDSLSSYRKRFLGALEEMIRKGEDFALLTDERDIRFLRDGRFGSGPLPLDKIYTLKFNGNFNGIRTNI